VRRVLLTTIVGACIAARVAAQGPVAAAPAAGAPAAKPPAANQQTSRTAIIDEMVQLGLNATKHNVPHPFGSAVGDGAPGLAAAYLIAIRSDGEGHDADKALLKALEARSQTQSGASSNSTASTSVAEKGLVPEILGFALENGAINRDVSGTTMTFHATPMGIGKALTKQRLPELFADYSTSGWQRYAAKLSLSASFDTSRGPSAGTLTADSHQLSAWTVKYEAVNTRDPGGAQYAPLWKEIATNSPAYQAAVKALAQALNSEPAFKTWQTAVVAQIDAIDAQLANDKDAAAAAVKAKRVLDAEMPKLAKIALGKTSSDALDAYVAELTNVQKRIDAVYDFAAKGVLATAQWATTIDPSLPDLYAVTGVLEAGLGQMRNTDFTFNIAANFYKHTPESASSAFKSFEASAQLDHPLGSSFLLHGATATAALKYSYLPKDTVASGGTPDGVVAASATTGTAPKGSIVVAQGKITVPIKGTGMKVPLSVTASNRTELIKEKDVRASIGVTFDMDTLLTALQVSAK
jgi:hypothetical protein